MLRKRIGIAGVAHRGRPTRHLLIGLRHAEIRGRGGHPFDPRAFGVRAGDDIQMRLLQRGIRGSQRSGGQETRGKRWAEKRGHSEIPIG